MPSPWRIVCPAMSAMEQEKILQRLRSHRILRPQTAPTRWRENTLAREIPCALPRPLWVLTRILSRNKGRSAAPVTPKRAAQLEIRAGNLQSNHAAHSQPSPPRTRPAPCRPPILETLHFPESRGSSERLETASSEFPVPAAADKQSARRHDRARAN